MNWNDCRQAAENQGAPFFGMFAFNGDWNRNPKCILLSQLATNRGVYFSVDEFSSCLTRNVGNPAFNAFYSQIEGVYAIYSTVIGTSPTALAAPGSTIEIVHDDELDASTLAVDLYVGCYKVPGYAIFIVIFQIPRCSYVD